MPYTLAILEVEDYDRWKAASTRSTPPGGGSARGPTGSSGRRTTRTR